MLVGQDPASMVYTRNKEKAAAKAGIRGRLHRLEATTSEADLLAFVQKLNADDDVELARVKTAWRIAHAAFESSLVGDALTAMARVPDLLEGNTRSVAPRWPEMPRDTLSKSAKRYSPESTNS